MKRIYNLLALLVLFSVAGFTGLQEAFAATPTTQARNLTFSNITSTGATITWLNGNGTGRIVVVFPNTTPVGNIDADVETGETYTANTDFTSGLSTTLGTTGKVVYLGTGSTRTVTITGLSANTTYNVKVYEYRNDGAPDPEYNEDSGTNNPRTFTTQTAAVNAPTSLNNTSIKFNGWTANWTASTPAVDGYELQIGNNASPITVFTDWNNVDIGNLTSYEVDGFSQNTGYNWRLRAYKGNDYSAYTAWTSVTTATDNTPPTALTIARLLPTTTNTPTNSSTVTFRVTFSEDVTGVASGDFALDQVDVTGATIGTVSEVSATEYDVTVNSIAGDGTISIDFTGTVTDLAGNNSVATKTDGETFTIDNIAPTVTSVAFNVVGAGDEIISEADVAQDNFTVAVTFSEEMNTAVGVDIDFTPSLSTTLTNGTGAWSVSNTVYTVTYDIADDNVSADDIVANVYYGEDLVGNEMDAHNSIETFDVDMVAPELNQLSITGVSISANSLNGTDRTNLLNLADDNTALVYLNIADRAAGDLAYIRVNSNTSDATLTNGDFTIQYSTDNFATAGITLKATGGADRVFNIDGISTNHDITVAADDNLGAALLAADAANGVTYSFRVVYTDVAGNAHTGNNNTSGETVVKDITAPAWAGKVTNTVSTEPGTANFFNNGGQKHYNNNTGNLTFDVNSTTADPTIDGRTFYVLPHNDDTDIDLVVTYGNYDFLGLGTTGVINHTITGTNFKSDLTGLSIANTVNLKFTVTGTDIAGNPSTQMFLNDNELTPAVFTFRYDVTAPTIGPDVNDISFSPASGVSKIGDHIDITVKVTGIDNVTFTTPGLGYNTVNGTTSTNGVNASILTPFAENGGNTVGVLRYTVAEGNNNVADAAVVKFNVHFYDQAGNTRSLTEGWYSGDDTKTPGIDATRPTITNIVRTASAAQLTNATTVSYTVTFSEDVTGVVAGDFTVGTAGSVASVTPVSASVYTVVCSTAVVDPTYESTLTFTGEATDLAGNAITNKVATTNETYIVDRTAPATPVPTLATAGGNVVANYFNGTNTGVTITFTIPNDATLVGGNYWLYYSTADGGLGTYFSINNVTPPAYYSAVSIIADNGNNDDGNVNEIGKAQTITLSKAVLDALTSTLDNTHVLRFQLRIFDNAGNLTDQETATNLTVDLTAPVMTIAERVVSATGTNFAAFSTLSSQYTNADYIGHRVTFSENVSIDNSGFYDTGGLNGATRDDNNTSDATPNLYSLVGSGHGRYSENGGIDDNWIVYGRFNGNADFYAGLTINKVTDVAGNYVTTSGHTVVSGLIYLTGTSGFPLTVDNIAPGVNYIRNAANTSTQLVNTATVQYDVQFSENVEFVNGVDFAIAPVSASVATVTAGVNNANYAVVCSTGVDGIHTLTVDAGHNITDRAGNALSSPLAGTNQTYTVDRTLPTITSIARTGGADQLTNATTISYTVTFSECVTGVADADFSVATAGSIASVTMSNCSTYVVVCSTAVSTYTSTLSAIGVITDDAGNALTVPTNGTSNQTYSVDRGVPTVTSLIVSIDGNSDNSIYGWGYNEYGKLGAGSVGQFPVPETKIGTATNWSKVSAGLQFTLAIKEDGTLWAWGLNNAGQLGIGNTTNQSAPVQVGTATNWTQISAYYNHSVALNSLGELYTWGADDYGKLGNGGGGVTNTPVKIGSDTWIYIASGYDHTLAIRNDGTLWACGRGAYGRLGQGNETDQESLVQVGTATNWIAVAGGDHHTVALNSLGEVWTFGYNNWGQLGVGDKVNRLTPVQVGTATNWSKITAGNISTFMLNTSGELWGTGHNNSGELGIGSFAEATSPVKVLGSNYVSMEAQSYTTAAINSSGELYTWGDNTRGQMGITTVQEFNHTPTRVGTSTSWSAISVGWQYMIGINNPLEGLVTEAFLGVDKFSVEVNFSESMKNTIAPVLTFTPSVSSTLTNGAGTWSNSDQRYTMVYDLADANIELSGIDISVTTAEDLSGNVIAQTDYPNEFSIDTKAPAQAGIASLTSVTGTVVPNYYNSTNGSVSFTFTIPNDTTLVGGTYTVQYTLDGTSFADLTTPDYTANAIIAADEDEVDGNVGEIGKLQTITITEAQLDVLDGGTIDNGDLINFRVNFTDVAGNSSGNGAEAPVDILVDQTAPVISGVTFTPSSGLRGVGQTVVATVTMSANESTGSVGAVTINGVTITSGSITAPTNANPSVFTATYTVVEGNTDIADATKLPFSIGFTDAAGNSATAFTDANLADATSTPGIDANSPALANNGFYVPADVDGTPDATGYNAVVPRIGTGGYAGTTDSKKVYGVLDAASDDNVYFRVRVANDASLEGGTIQLQAQNNTSGTWANLGSAHTIVNGNLNSTVDMTVTEVQLAGLFAQTQFRAVITDVAGNTLNTNTAYFGDYNTTPVNYLTYSVVPVTLSITSVETGCFAPGDLFSIGITTALPEYTENPANYTVKLIEGLNEYPMVVGGVVGDNTTSKTLEITIPANTTFATGGLYNVQVTLTDLDGNVGNDTENNSLSISTTPLDVNLSLLDNVVCAEESNITIEYTPNIVIGNNEVFAVYRKRGTDAPTNITGVSTLDNDDDDLVIPISGNVLDGDKFYLVFADGNGVCGEVYSDTVTVTVNPTPTAATITRTGTENPVCFNDATGVVFTADSSVTRTGFTYSWSYQTKTGVGAWTAAAAVVDDANTDLNADNTVITSRNMLTTYAGVDSVRFVVTKTNSTTGCNITTTSTVVGFNKELTATIGYGSASTAQRNQTISYTFTAPTQGTPTSYEWRVVDASNNAISSSFVTFTSTTTTLTNNIYFSTTIPFTTYYIQVRAIGACNTAAWPAATGGRAVTVNPTPSSSISFTSVGQTQMTVGWTNGTYDGKYIISTQNSGTTNFMAGAVTNTGGTVASVLSVMEASANLNWSTASSNANFRYNGSANTGSNLTVPDNNTKLLARINNNTDRNITVTGLVKSKRYHFRIIDFNNTTTPTDLFLDASGPAGNRGTSAKDGDEFSGPGSMHSVSAISPNPAKDFINFDLTLVEDANVTITIHSLEGSVVMNIKANELMSAGTHNFNIPLKDLAAGAYAISFSFGQDAILETFMVMP